MGFASKEQLQELMQYMGENIHVPQLVQHFDSDCIYSTDEQIIGCWIDGRPVYQKVISLGSLPNVTAKNVAHGVSNIGDVVNAWAYANSGIHRSPIPYVSADTTIIANMDVTTTNVVINTNTNLSSYTGYAIIQYTKTTDAVNSYNIAKENTYNLTEKVVGKWVDGSTLYQKTIEMGVLTNALSTEATKTAAHGISNLSKVVSVIGHWYLTANPTTGGMIPYCDKNYYISALTQSGNNVAVNYKGDWSTATVFVTIQYTKTS